MLMPALAPLERPKEGGGGAGVLECEALVVFKAVGNVVLAVPDTVALGICSVGDIVIAFGPLQQFASSPQHHVLLPFFWSQGVIL